jgi:hypothetical protein
VVKTLEAQVDQCLMGCKCPVSRLLPDQAKDYQHPCMICKIYRALLGPLEGSHASKGPTNLLAQACSSPATL